MLRKQRKMLKINEMPQAPSLSVSPGGALSPAGLVLVPYSPYWLLCPENAPKTKVLQCAMVSWAPPEQAAKPPALHCRPLKALLSKYGV